MALHIGASLADRRVTSRAGVTSITALRGSVVDDQGGYSSPSIKAQNFQLQSIVEYRWHKYATRVK